MDSLHRPCRVEVSLHPGATSMPLPADLQSVLDCYMLDLNEREIAQRLGITRHEARERLKKAFEIIRPHVLATVADGEGI